jgi:hypothetical protein
MDFFLMFPLGDVGNLREMSMMKKLRLKKITRVLVGFS